MCTPAGYNVGLVLTPGGDPPNLNCTDPAIDGARDRCGYMAADYDATTSVVCALSIVLGVIYSLFGYRCFKAVMFLTGFSFGSSVVYLICMEEHVLPPLGNAGVSLGAGLLFGLITMLVQYVGLFMTGLQTGLYLGVVTILSTLPLQPFSNVWHHLAVLLGLGLAGAVATLRFHRAFTVLATSVHGGAVLTLAMDQLVEKRMLTAWVVAVLRRDDDVQSPCWFSWLILALWPFMTLLGVVVQASLTATGVHHQMASPRRKSHRTVDLQRARMREARVDLHQRKHRYLYHVRTQHGDVIAQEYLQSLNGSAAQNCCDQSTLQSNCTRVTSLATALSESEHEVEVTGVTASRYSGASGVHSCRDQVL